VVAADAPALSPTASEHLRNIIIFLALCDFRLGLLRLAPADVGLMALLAAVGELDDGPSGFRSVFFATVVLASAFSASFGVLTAADLHVGQPLFFNEEKAPAIIGDIAAPLPSLFHSAKPARLTTSTTFYFCSIPHGTRCPDFFLSQPLGAM
jgi:hypothetical protein